MTDKIKYKLLNEEILTRYHPKDKNGIITVKTASHGNCGSRCLIKVHIKEGQILSLDTESKEDCSKDKQFRSCVKGHSYLDTFLNKDRLLYPLKRTGPRGEGRFKRITWEEALQTIADEMIRIKNKYGVSSRYCNYATGYEMCCLTPADMMKRLLALDGGFLNYYNNYSNSPSTLAAKLTYGTDFTGNSRNDYINSKLIILWGYNPAETACGGGTMHALLKAKEAGAKIIVIDARYSDTAAALADQWISPLPTTDNSLSDAMAYIIYKNNLHNKAFLDQYCIGFDEDTMPEHVESDSSYLSYLLGKKDGITKTPQWAAKISGVPAKIIEDLALEYADTHPAAILEGYGPGRHACGEQFSRGLITLACMTGNVGVSGGSAAGVGQVPYATHLLPSFPPAVTNPYPGKIPCFSWTDAVADAKSITKDDGLKYVDHLDSEIKMIFNLAGNCLINQHGNCNYTASLLKDTSKVEFIVCSDIFMTSSAKFADILLPGTTMFETENITASTSRFDHFFKINPIMIPPGECRFDYDWICDLADLLGYGEQFHENKTSHQWLEESVNFLKKKILDFPTLEELSKIGVYKRDENKKIIAFKEQITDLNNHPFQTPSGKIELFVMSLYQEKDSTKSPIPRYITAPEGPEDHLKEKYPLQCIGYHTKARTHSIHDNNSFLQKEFQQEIWIHPEDAKVRNIKNGDKVLIINDRGKIKINAKVTDRICKGVTAIPQGAWYSPDSTGIDTRGCINTITSLRTTPIAKANAQHTNLVEVLLDHSVSDDKNIKLPDIVISPKENCCGCKTCVAACVHVKQDGISKMRVLETPTGDPIRPVFYQPISCKKCKVPACEAACPSHLFG